MKSSGLNTCIWLALYLKYIFSFQKALCKVTNAEIVPLRGNSRHYWLPVHMESPCGPKSTGNQPGLFSHIGLQSGSWFLLWKLVSERLQNTLAQHYMCWCALKNEVYNNRCCSYFMRCICAWVFALITQQPSCFDITYFFPEREAMCGNVIFPVQSSEQSCPIKITVACLNVKTIGQKILQT